MNQQKSTDFHLSKSLCTLLRHNALKEGLQISSEGYINVSDILNHKFFKGKYSVDDIERVVKNNNKQRFTLRRRNFGILEICANQGHSIKEVDKTNLESITSSGKLQVIHGTYLRNWQSIKTQGLSCMKRNHIHFASALNRDKEVISGMRQTCEVFIYVNMSLALSEGLKFFKSVNSVILSPGNKEGIIKPKYFFKVIDAKGNNLML